MNVGITCARRKVLRVGDLSRLGCHSFFVGLLAYVKGVGEGAVRRVRWASRRETVMAIARECLGLFTRYGDWRSTRYELAMEGWVEDYAKLGKASGKLTDRLIESSG
jgi:hypothetical protein